MPPKGSSEITSNKVMPPCVVWPPFKLGLQFLSIVGEALLLEAADTVAFSFELEA